MRREWAEAGGNTHRARILSSVLETEPAVSSEFWDGARRTRTADLLGAIQALSQLSYSPGGTPDCSRAQRGVVSFAGALQKRASSACGMTRGLSCACGIAAPPMRMPSTTSHIAAVTRAQNLSLIHI